MNSKGLDEWTALHYATEENAVEIMKFLLIKKADVNSLSQTERSPLHIACLRGNLEATQLLFEFECDPNLQDFYQHTALHYAS